MICAKSPDKVPDSKKIRAATVGLAALDIIFGDGRPVFYFERNWQKGVDAAFMDNREGGQWSIRFSDSGSLFKGTHSQAFMFPGGNPPFEKERKHGLATYPGVLVGFPEKLTFLLSDPDPFQEITFCLWADSKAAPWQVGAVCWPEEVDDPDASEELIAYLESPSEAFIELAKDVYGVVVKDKGAVESIFKKEPLTPELLRRLTNSVSLASIAIALGDISYPVSFEEVQSASKTGFAAKTSAQGAQATDDKTRDFYRDDHLLDPDSTIAETAMGAIRGLGGMLADAGLGGVKDRAGEIAQTAQSGIAAAISGITNVIVPDPPDSPMAREPLFKWWKGLHTRLILSKREGMSNRISAITERVSDEYHLGREVCFGNFVKDMEESFVSMPDFLSTTFSELAKIYADRDFRKEAEILRKKTALWQQNFKEAGSHATGNRDLPRLVIHVPLSDRGFSLEKLLAELSSVLAINKIRGQQLSLGKGLYPYRDSREYGHVTIDAPQWVLTDIVKLCMPVLQEQKLPRGSYMLDDKGVRHELSA